MPHSSYEDLFVSHLDHQTQAFGFWKGRVALFAILKALDIGPGDEVIAPGFTCVVVANAIRFAGAKPVFVDIEAEGYNMDPQLVQQAITPRTKAVIAQHTFGIPAQIKAVQAICVQHSLALIEDCAHVFGSSLNGTPLGSVGQAAFYSSQWSKPYTTGLGGIATTRDPSIASALVSVQESFQPPPRSAQNKVLFQVQLYERLYSPKLYWRAQALLHAFGSLGLFVASSNQDELDGKLPPDYQWRMADFQRRVGSRKLLEIENVLEHRRCLSKLYDERLQNSGWPSAQRPKGSLLLRYPVRVSNKDDLLEQARTSRVELGSWFETPLHPTPLDQHPIFGYDLGICPRAERIAQQVVNLPLHSKVTPMEADRILRFFLEHARLV